MKKKFHLSMVVWGEAYVDLFLRVTLPTLLANGNLPALAAFGECRFSIYSRKRDEAACRSHSAFAVLSSLMPVEFIDIEKEQSQQSAWLTMTTCQNRAITQAKLAGAYVVFIIPDHVYSDDSFRTVIKAIEQGYKGVLVFQIPAIRESFIEAFLPAYYDDRTHQAVVTPEALLALWKEHKHPGSDFFLWDSRHFPNESSCLIGWRGREDDSFLVRSSQFTPMILLPETDFLLPTDGTTPYTMDTVLAKNLVMDQSKIYIVQDSNEGVQVDMRPLSESYAMSFDRPNIPMIACHLNGFKSHGNGNVAYMDRPVCFHSGKVESAQKNLAAQADPIYNTIKDLADFDTVEQFREKLRKYFLSKADGRKFAVLGAGYIAELTRDFLQSLGLEAGLIDSVGQLTDHDYLLLARDMSKMEALFFQLSVKGFRYEDDFLITPFIYRQFRQRVPGRRSWKRYYYDYYMTARENGMKWTLTILWNKLTLKVFRPTAVPEVRK